MTYIRAWISLQFGQIRSRTTELAALERLKSMLKSGERLQDHWSSGYYMLGGNLGTFLYGDVSVMAECEHGLRIVIHMNT